MVVTRIREVQFFSQNVTESCIAVYAFEWGGSVLCRGISHFVLILWAYIHVLTHTSISKINIPSVHQSTVVQWWFPRIISGARYSARKLAECETHWIRQKLAQVNAKLYLVPSVPTNELAFNFEIHDFVSRLGD
jgi:hypothetical protein